MLKDLRFRCNGDFADTLEHIIEFAPDGIITIDIEQTIVMFNRAAETIFGYSMKEAIGQSLTIILPPDIREGHKHHVRKFSNNHTQRNGWCSTNGVTTFPVRGCRKSGEEFPAEITISKTTYNDVEYFTSIVRDISDRVARESKIKDQEEELAKYRISKKAELMQQVREVADREFPFGNMDNKRKFHQ